MYCVQVYKDVDEFNQVISELLHKIETRGVTSKVVANNMATIMTNFTRAVEKSPIKHLISDILFQEFDKKNTLLQAFAS
jgi:hypothetical protein